MGHGPLLGGDLLDGNIGGLHTNFQVSATLSKKVKKIFPKRPIFQRFTVSDVLLLSFFFILPKIFACFRGRPIIPGVILYVKCKLYRNFSICNYLL